MNSQFGLSHQAIYRRRRAMGIYPRPHFHFQKEDLEKLYLDERKSLKEVANLLGCSRDTVANWLRYFRIPIRTRADGYGLAVKQGKLKGNGRGLLGNKFNWKGQRLIVNGYVYVYKPGHPRASRNKRVLEHILVWEEIHQHPLPKGWIIHHLNGNKSDNRPENLVASPSQNHYDFISALKKRIKELETEIERLTSALQHKASHIAQEANNG